MVALEPVQFSTGGADGEGGVEEDEQVGMTDALPHILDVGMFLRNVAADIAARFELRDEGGFTRPSPAEKNSETNGILRNFTSPRTKSKTIRRSRL